ncbi:hypothetical protein G4G28_18450 [Massilia sp. Dwa41.01b]|nr:MULTISPECIES: hypothetical protein [unclassified Massilia]QNA87233.1 hypothetical protein G4G28_18450 [Massilia sp. Dwa41.01b]QNA97569.1 hypothetical protein G4G31_22030 [Massilia sp. Se16.2.3]
MVVPRGSRAHPTILAIVKAIAERHGAQLTLDKSERLGGLAATGRFL